jgi:peptidyl-prolyl cis-trans isomerase D
MLASMRKGAGTWVARIFLFVLVLAFVGWGIGDFLRGSTDRSVATVGGVKIPASVFDTQFRRELQQLQQQIGSAIDIAQARNLGLIDSSLHQLIDRTLLDQETRRLGVIVSDEIVAGEIRNNPAFRNSLGQFDKSAFDQKIAAQGWTEASFFEIARGDTARGMVLTSLTAGARTPPKLLVDTLYGYRNERRVAEVLVVPPAAAGPVADPDDAAVEKYYKDHVADFTAPEYRAISYVALTPQDLAAEVPVSDQELKDEYEAHKDALTVPEKRTVEQILYPNEATAKSAFDKIKGGGDFAAVAKETVGQAPTVFKDVAKQELQSELADTAFTLGKGESGGPIKTGLGWNLLRIDDIKPGAAPSFDKLKDEIRRGLALRAAGDLAQRRYNSLQDELAGGATLAQAAEKLKLKLVKLPVLDATGKDADGKQIESLPKAPTFLQTAFEAPVGGEAQTVEVGDGSYFVLKADGDTPAAARPLPSVRDRVVAAWKAEAGKQSAVRKAKEIADKLSAGGDFAALAKSVSGSIETTKPMTRSGDGADDKFTGTLLTALFKLKAGAVTTAPLGTAGSAVVVRLLRIVPADPKADAPARLALADTVGNGIANDLVSEYQVALDHEFGVSINHDVLNTLF